MAVGAAGSDRVAFESPRGSAVPTESGNELSKSFSEQHSQNYTPTRNISPSPPCIAPHETSPTVSGARNENVLSASSTTENSNPDSKQNFSLVFPKLARHPQTESTELKEIWSDITSKTTNHNQADQEQKASEKDGALVLSDSNIDSSRISWVLRKHPWTRYAKYVELWSDIPGEDREDLTGQNDVVTFAKAASLSKNMNDIQQCRAITSGMVRNSFTEFEMLTEVSSISPDDSISNQNYIMYLEKEKFSCCRLFSQCFREFQSFAINFRKQIFLLVVKILVSLMPISAVCMGVIHVGTCPANERVTHLVYMTGIAGVVLIISHIAYHFTNDLKEVIRGVINVFQTITAVLLTIEMILFYSMSPSFENSENYCDETFYNFTFYMNIAAAGIVFLSVLLQHTSNTEWILKHFRSK